ncbi:MAG: hypothetical protein MUC93_01670 [Bacteroidales bacterium]|jgi:hypothetical protein|nr:hypothetical protein [Bacteroidales bacterium]
MKKIFIYSVLFALMMISCDKEDFTGYSTIVPTAPTITVTGIPANINFVEKDSTFTFNVTMSVAQVVDVVLVAKQISGTAKEGEDFKILNDAGKLTILAGATTGQFKLKILADDVKEVTETATVQIGNETTANAAFTPVNVTFTIQNSSTDELSVDMSWDTDVLDAVGVDLTPIEVADMRLLIVDSNGDIVDGADGAAFESWAGFNALPDGVYRVAADFYATLDFGDINAPVTLSLSLEFNQPGVINNETLDFPDVMTNENPCDAYRTYLATVTKAGTSYTIEKSVQAEWSADFASLQGPWTGTDQYDFNYDVNITLIDDTLFIYGLGVDMIENYWGEPVTAHDAVPLLFDWSSLGAVEIEDQYYFTTVFSKVHYDYNIVGTGKLSLCGAEPVLTIEYDIKYSEDGWSIGEYVGGLFVATLTPASTGKSISISDSKNMSSVMSKLPQKPVR